MLVLAGILRWEAAWRARSAHWPYSAGRHPKLELCCGGAVRGGRGLPTPRLYLRGQPLVGDLSGCSGAKLLCGCGGEGGFGDELNPLLATIIGGITGVGGGNSRGVWARCQGVRSDVYAAAALFGAAITIVCLRLRVNGVVASSCGILGCFVLRMLAVYRHWNLPGAARDYHQAAEVPSPRDGPPGQKSQVCPSTSTTAKVRRCL